MKHTSNYYADNPNSSTKLSKGVASMENGLCEKPVKFQV